MEEAKVDGVVKLVVSGYEWICQDCGTLNRQPGLSEYVICEECNHVFLVVDFHQTHE